MILNVWSPASGNLCLNHKTLKSRSYSVASATKYLRANGASSVSRNSWPSGGNPFQKLSASSTPLLSGDLGNLSRTIPTLPHRRQPRSLTPRAAKDVPYSFRYPAMTTKPKWYWRTLACLPYLMPLHETWMYAETAYHLHPFLEDLEFLTYPFLESLGRLPSWFLMAYFFVAYLGVVRKKEWPHFFRFHVVMGMLLEISLQIVGTVSRWMPLAIYWGKVGMHFWTAIAFAYLFTVLECLRCALSGMYADVPFVCDAAYIQIPYELELHVRLTGTGTGPKPVQPSGLEPVRLTGQRFRLRLTATGINQNAKTVTLTGPVNRLNRLTGPVRVNRL